MNARYWSLRRYLRTSRYPVLPGRARPGGVPFIAEPKDQKIEYYYHSTVVLLSLPVVGLVLNIHIDDMKEVSWSRRYYR